MTAPNYPQPLTERFVANIKAGDQYKKYSYGCGTGMALDVSISGAKTWKVRIRRGSNGARVVTLGSYPEMSVAVALKACKKTKEDYKKLTVKEIDDRLGKMPGRLGLQTDLDYSQDKEFAQLKDLQTQLNTRMEAIKFDSAKLDDVRYALELVDKELNQFKFDIKVMLQNALSLQRTVFECKHILLVLDEEKDLLEGK